MSDEKNITLTDSIALAQALIRCRSVTPEDDGALDIVENFLTRLGFTCHRLVFGQVQNIFARLGEGSPALCFAGHTDVVPTGDESGWDYPPFEARIVDDRLYGRGVSDMKGALAAFLTATALYLKENRPPQEGSPKGSQKGSLCLLITGDEEGDAIDGTQKVLAWMARQKEQIDDCLIGEPSNPNYMGEAIKTGRRGSINMDLTVIGQQGHAANPHLAANPIPVMGKILTRLDQHVFDQGNEYFMPSNLELSSVDTNNPARNVIPARVQAQFNIRYNNIHQPDDLKKIVETIIAETCSKKEKITWQLDCRHNGDPFFTPPCAFADLVCEQVRQITGRKPERATYGGTSDGRYIKDYARVVEFGLTTKTIHKTNEWAFVRDIRQLTEIYLGIIKNYFA